VIAVPKMNDAAPKTCPWPGSQTLSFRKPRPNRSIAGQASRKTVTAMRPTSTSAARAAAPVIPWRRRSPGRTENRRVSFGASDAGLAATAI
jgi:hypothetical protein